MCSGRILARMAAACAFLAATVLATDDLQALVTRLALEEFKERERTAAELAQLGLENPEPVQQACLHHYLHDGDPEIRKRCKDVLRQLLAKSAGFLGLRHQPRSYFDADGELRPGVEVVELIPDLQAEKAGLKIGDIIVSLDGKSFDDTITSDEFARRVRLLGAGKAIAIGIERDGVRREVQATTGAAPNDVDTVDPEARFKEWLESKTRKGAPTSPEP